MMYWRRPRQGKRTRRPTVEVAIAVSLAAHAVILSVAGIVWTRPMRDSSLVGRRQVIYVELAFAQPAAHEPVHVESPAEPLPERLEVTEPLEDPPTDATIEILARPLPPAQPVPTQALASLDSLAELPEREPTEESPNLLVERTVERAPPDVPDARPRKLATSTEAPRRVERQQREVVFQQPAVMAQTIIGVEDKEPPDLSGNRPPAYPVEALRRRWEGTVLLRLRIGETGRVEGVEVVRSSGYPILDRSAIAAVKTWQGRPATQGGQAVATEEVLPVRFRL